MRHGTRVRRHHLHRRGSRRGPVRRQRRGHRRQRWHHAQDGHHLRNTRLALNLCHNCDCTCFGCRVSVTSILLRLTAALLGAGAALLALNPVVVVIALRDQLSCVSPNVPEGSMKPEQPCCLETVGSCRARIELRLLLVKLLFFFFLPHSFERAAF